MNRLHRSWFYFSRIGIAILGLAVRSSGGEAVDREPAAVQSVRLASASTVSESFRCAAEFATSSIPSNVWKGVRDAGWRVQLAEFVSDALPRRIQIHPRGWPAGLTWDHADAASLPQSRLLILAEKRRKRDGDVVSTHRVDGVLRHEFGHAFDMTANPYYRFQSSTSEFQRAYLRDVAELTSQDRREMAYYLQSQGAGRQEAFAEAFAAVLGGGSDVTKSERFCSAFPSVIQYLRREIEAYDP